MRPMVSPHEAAHHERRTRYDVPMLTRCAILLAVALLTGCAGKPAPVTLTAQPVLAADAHLQQPAVVDLVFTNNTERPLILPTGRLLIGRNLFIRLYAADAPNPFPPGKPVEATGIPPFAVPGDEMVTIAPGASHTYRFESFMRWITFTTSRTADEYLRIDEWRLVAHFTGRYHTEESDPPGQYWVTPVTSEPVRVRLSYPRDE